MMIPISHKNGEVSEKAGSGSRGDGFWGLGKIDWKSLAVSRRKYWAGSAQLTANGFILTSRRVKKLIPVYSRFELRRTRSAQFPRPVAKGGLGPEPGDYAGPRRPHNIPEANRRMQRKLLHSRLLRQGRGNGAFTLGRPGRVLSRSA